jgi:hypothetical protein
VADDLCREGVEIYADEEKETSCLQRACAVSGTDF